MSGGSGCLGGCLGGWVGGRAGERASELLLGSVITNSNHTINV